MALDRSPAVVGRAHPRARRQPGHRDLAAHARHRTGGVRRARARERRQRRNRLLRAAARLHRPSGRAPLPRRDRGTRLGRRDDARLAPHLHPRPSPRAHELPGRRLSRGPRGSLHGSSRDGRARADAPCGAPAVVIPLAAAPGVNRTAPATRPTTHVMICVFRGSPDGVPCRSFSPRPPCFTRPMPRCHRSLRSAPRPRPSSTARSTTACGRGPSCRPGRGAPTIRCTAKPSRSRRTCGSPTTIATCTSRSAATIRKPRRSRPASRAATTSGATTGSA